MLFSSLTFLLFFMPTTIVVYFLLPKKFRNYLLLAASLFFYAWGEPIFVVLMIMSILLNYFFGLKISNKSNKKWLFIAIFANVMILSFFKYGGFFVDSLNNLPFVNISFNQPPLPIGISFFTFQALSYLIDVYRKIVDPQKNIIKLALYISLFPQLIAGPIVRYASIHKELTNRKESLKKITAGIQRFIIGLSKKVLIANQIGLISEEIIKGGQWENSIYLAWLGIILFGLQIYYDFSGYSDMAIGLGKIFGFKFPENFNYPYTSKSISEFWRRWHMTLGSWFRDYLYIPLGGNREEGRKTVRNLFIVWLLTGLWHGASWNFALWGLYFSFFIALEKTQFFKKISRKISKYLMWAYSSIVVFAGWALFSIEDTGNSLHYFKKLFLNNPRISEFTGSYLGFLIKEEIIIFIIAIIFVFPVKELFKNYQKEEKLIIAPIKNAFFVLLLALNIIYLINSTFNPFIYFRF